jgi:1-acyl-sn-glycerol-3-phosphate acyltransferase
MTVLRSALFNLAFFTLTAVMSVLALPLLAAPRGWVMRVIRLWARIVVAMLRGICGVTLEVEGLDRIQPGAAVLAAKHQSAFDTIIWLMLLPDPAYVLKKELVSIPLYGWFCRKVGMIPVDRSGGGAALRAMLRAAQSALEDGRQVVIFPEGTRTAPGERVPYQPGVVAVAGASSAPVFPVATDSGRVWGRHAFHKRSGTIHITVLPPLPSGLPRARLIPALETAIETESQRLLMMGELVDKPVG